MTNKEKPRARRETQKRIERTKDTEPWTSTLETQGDVMAPTAQDCEKLAESTAAHQLWEAEHRRELWGRLTTERLGDVKGESKVHSVSPRSSEGLIPLTATLSHPGKSVSHCRAERPDSICQTGWSIYSHHIRDCSVLPVLASDFTFELPVQHDNTSSEYKYINRTNWEIINIPTRKLHIR